MKLSDYMLHNRIVQGSFWTLFTTRMFRLEKAIPPRVYYVKDSDELQDLMSQMMGGLKPPNVSPGQALSLQDCDIKEVMSRLQEARGAVIMNKSCDGIKEIILAARCNSDTLKGLTPLFRVRWNKSSASFVSERLAGEAYINQIKEDN